MEKYKLVLDPGRNTGDQLYNQLLNIRIDDNDLKREYHIIVTQEDLDLLNRDIRTIDDSDIKPGPGILGGIKINLELDGDIHTK
jgi:hypothetical protein